VNRDKGIANSLKNISLWQALCKKEKQQRKNNKGLVPREDFFVRLFMYRKLLWVSEAALY
jgi:hypothetical protein